MGVVTFSVPKDLVRNLVSNLEVNNFVETGTYEGGSCFWAADYFKDVYTIEIDAEISKSTSLKPNCPKNIKFLVGDSKDILPELCRDQLKGRSFFWLDGHWCGGEVRADECPLMFELEAIKNQHDPIIFIDDARCFLGPPPLPHNPDHWPSIDEIFGKLKELFPRNFTTIHDDVIMSVPPDAVKIINDDWTKNFNKRFSSEEQQTTVQQIRRFFFNRQ